MDAERARRKAFTLARELGFTREERIEFAQMLTADEEIGSWSDLDDEGVRRVLDGLEGFLLVSEVLRQRPPVEAPATGVKLIEWPTVGPEYHALRHRLAEAIIAHEQDRLTHRACDGGQMPRVGSWPDRMAARIVEELARG